MLDSYGIRIGIEVREGLILGDPAAVEVVGDGQLTSLVVHLQDDVLAEILQRDFPAQTVTMAPYLTGPLLELEVVSHPPLQCDRIVFGAPRCFAAATWITTLAMLHYLGSALQGTDLGETCDVFAIPLETKFKVFIRVETLCIDSKLLSHKASLY